MEINYPDDLFGVVYRNAIYIYILNAIDHIEYHSTLQDEPSSKTRSKCSVFFSETGS